VQVIRRVLVIKVVMVVPVAATATALEEEGIDFREVCE
jgi:hypothetical protein